ncbi:MAG: hypothetical protein GF408_03775 [Candidatus Omnitrophica bacterium]|nr:hypothetical protein [Candidatus Omnitrophota bacterium]
MPDSLTDYAKDRLREIHSLSAEYNGNGGNHTDKLLDLVDKHAEEIRELYSSGDGHFAVEVGDLLILCYELLLEEKKSSDGIMDICYDRYIGKLRQLIDDKGAA